MKIDESLNVTFNERLPEPKSSSSVEDDRIIEPVVQNPVRSLSLKANVLEPGYPKSLKEARGHPIEQVIDLREENKDMFSSINEAIKLMLAVATNMSCVIENDIRKEESKDNLKE
ncbi:hypothetical protein Tco_0410992 [Tanacetum coccineum]